MGRRASLRPLCLCRGTLGPPPGRGEQGQGEPRSSQHGPEGLAAAGTWGSGSAVHEGQHLPALKSWGTHGWVFLQLCPRGASRLFEWVKWKQEGGGDTPHARPFSHALGDLPPTAWAANPSCDLRDAGAAGLCPEPCPEPVPDQAHPDRPGARLSPHPGLL